VFTKIELFEWEEFTDTAVAYGWPRCVCNPGLAWCHPSNGGYFSDLLVEFGGPSHLQYARERKWEPRIPSRHVLSIRVHAMEEVSAVSTNHPYGCTVNVTVHVNSTTCYAMFGSIVY
jgi:hypothetical protein